MAGDNQECADSTRTHNTRNTIIVYDELCAWPYHQPYGMVAVPKPKKPRKPRKSRSIAKPKFVRPKQKKEKPDGPTRKRRSPRKPKRVVEAPAEVRQAAILEATPQGFTQ